MCMNPEGLELLMLQRSGVSGSDSVFPFCCPHQSTAGDIVGCGIDFTNHKIFYTKNQTFLGRSIFPCTILAII